MSAGNYAELGTVAIVTATTDLGADRVVSKLRGHSVNVFRLNTDRLPVEAHVELEVSGLWWADDGPHAVRCDEIKSVWLRKIRFRGTAETSDPDLHAYVCRESNAALRAFLASIPANAAWMSPISDIDRAELKPVQLAAARALGLSTPRSVTSSRPDMIRAFARSVSGRVIGKPLRSGYLRTRRGDFGIFTERLDETDLGMLDEALPCPIIVQEEIEKAFDVRVTVVGDRFFAAAIDSQTDPDAQVDWRRTRNPLLPHYTHELPSEVAAKCIVLLRRLGLAYGAIDFALTGDGAYFFLEVNPNGEWLWIEDQLGLPISDEIASWLARAAGKR